MKFVSKNANLMVVLRPGIPAQPITGTPAVPTLSARFQDGVVDIQDEKILGTLHVATGRSDHLGGHLTPDKFKAAAAPARYGTKDAVAAKDGAWTVELKPWETVVLVVDRAK
jgi:hypothetical protein